MTWLLDEWKRTCARAGLTADPKLGEELVARYHEPHRAYHTAAHLEQVLRRLEEIDAEPLLHLAAWFHDAIYVPGSPDNEIDSAKLAKRELAARGIDAASVQFVVDAILATAGHTSSDPRLAPLLDADLATLGAPPEEYRAYVAAIRREYDKVPDELFREGRRALLREFLQRDAIFKTVAAHQRYEAPARRNLEAELLA